MKIKEILLSIPTKKIYKAICKNYKKAKYNKNEYIKCINTLKKLSTQPYSSVSSADHRFVLEWIEQGLKKWYKAASGYYDASICGKTDKWSFLRLSFLDFVNLDIDEATLSKYSLREIISHAIWELTFYGFTEEESISFFTKLKDMIDNIKDVESLTQCKTIEIPGLEIVEETVEKLEKIKK